MPSTPPMQEDPPWQRAFSLEPLDLKRLISTAEVAHLAGVSDSSVRRWRYEDSEFPRARILGDRTLRWRLEEVLEWLDSRPLADDLDRTDKVVRAGRDAADRRARDAAAVRYLDQPLIPGAGRR